MYYQTEPESNCFASDRSGRPEPDEIWDFSLGNLEDCRRRLDRANARDQLTLRFVPPGYLEPAAAVQHDAEAVPPRLLFFGYPFFAKRGVCYRRLLAALGPSRLNATWSINSEHALDRWWAAEGRHSMHLHLHKHCGVSALQPAPAFRLSPLLSRGARVISEPCHPLDEAEYAGLVHFAPVDSIPAAYLARVAMRTATASAAVAAAFRERFTPARLFARAGVDSLAQPKALPSAAAVVDAAATGLWRVGYCAETADGVEGDCAEGDKGS